METYLKKFTFKKCLLCFILFVSCIFSVTAMCYDMAKFEFIYQGTDYTNYITVYMSQLGMKLSENGFGLLDGKSGLIDATFTGSTTAYTSTCIAILILAIISFSIFIYSIFTKNEKKQKGSEYAVLIINVVISAVYLVIGLLFANDCVDSYVEAIKETSGLDYGGDFKTVAYVPLILSVVIVALYFSASKFIKDDFSLIKVLGYNKNTEVTEEETYSEGTVDYGNIENRQRAPISDSDIDKLTKLKKLYDDGAITEEEYENQKNLILKG